MLTSAPMPKCMPMVRCCHGKRHRDHYIALPGRRFSGKVAVGVTAGVSALDLTTQAYIDGGATAIAKNNVLVSAQDETTSTLVSGNLNGGGNVAVGVGAGISVLTKNTNAYIASDAVVTALAQGTAVMANTGTFGTPTGSDTQSPAENIEFTTARCQGNNINVDPTGLNTGDEVVYSGAGLPLGGLDSGGEYYVISPTRTRSSSRRTTRTHKRKRHYVERRGDQVRPTSTRPAHQQCRRAVDHERERYQYARSRQHCGEPRRRSRSRAAERA